jgi:fibrillin 1
VRIIRKSIDFTTIIDQQIQITIAIRERNDTFTYSQIRPTDGVGSTRKRTIDAHRRRCSCVTTQENKKPKRKRHFFFLSIFFFFSVFFLKVRCNFFCRWEFKGFQKKNSTFTLNKKKRKKDKSFQKKMAFSSSFHVYHVWTQLVCVVASCIMLIRKDFQHDWYFQGFSVLSGLLSGCCSLALLSPEQSSTFVGFSSLVQKCKSYFRPFTQHVCTLSVTASSFLLCAWTVVAKCSNLQWSNPLLYLAAFQVLFLAYFLYVYVGLNLSSHSQQLLIGLYTLSFVIAGLSIVFGVYSLWLKLSFPWIDLGLDHYFPIQHWFIGLFVIGVLYFGLSLYNWIMIRQHAFQKGNVVSMILTFTLMVLMITFTSLVVSEEVKISQFVHDNCFGLTQHVHQDTWTNQFQCQKYSLVVQGHPQDLTCDATNTTFGVAVWDAPNDQYGYQGCINTSTTCCSSLNIWLGFFLHIFYGLAFLMIVTTCLSLTLNVRLYFYQKRSSAAQHDLCECETQSFPSPKYIVAFATLYFLSLTVIITVALFVAFVRIPIQPTQQDPLTGKTQSNLISSLPSGCVDIPQFKSWPVQTLLSSTDGYFLLNTLDMDLPSIDLSRIQLNATSNVTFIAFCPICWTRSSSFKVQYPNGTWFVNAVAGRDHRVVKVNINSPVSPYHVSTLTHTLIMDWLIHCPELRVTTQSIDIVSNHVVCLNAWVPVDFTLDRRFVLVLSAAQHRTLQLPFLIHPYTTEVYLDPLEWADTPNVILAASSHTSSHMELQAVGCTCDPLQACLLGGVCGPCPSGYLLDGTTCQDVNECATNNGGCHPQQVCLNSVGSWTCSSTCNAGYVYSGTNDNTCFDINECATNNGGCNTFTSCINTLGSYTCGSTCATGFTFNGVTCFDVNECATLNGGCDPVAQSCVNTPGSRVCSPCECGFTQISETQCQDIDECSASSHSCQQTCVNTIGAYSCSCEVGFTLANNGRNCTNINECASSPCQNGATCVDGVNSFTCQCSVGYSGSNCEFNTNTCGSNPCQNGATCQTGVSSYTCSCPLGYEGVLCETNTQDCVNLQSQCGIHAVSCLDGIGSFVCVCEDGYFGAVCDSFINPCDSNPCQHGSSCTSAGPFSYACTCLTGYSGLLCETNINDCAVNGCLNNSTCVDGLNSYTCTCPTGYTGFYCQTLINPCTVNNGGCQQICTWSGIPGDFTCSCLAGYTATSFTCTDNNECALYPTYCGAQFNHGQCLNTPGSFSCHCFSGYEYQPFPEPSCKALNPCLNSTLNSCNPATSTCTSVYNSTVDSYHYSCTCLSGFEYVPTTQNLICQDIDECTSSMIPVCPTSPCYNYNGGYTCGVCPSGYQSSFNTTSNTYVCQDINECTTTPSGCDLSTTICTNSEGSFTCSCKYAFHNNNGTGCQSCNPCPGSCAVSSGFTCSRSGVDGCTAQCNCAPTNECATSNGGCASNRPCVDLTFGAFCSHCPVGFTEINPSTSLYDKLSCYDINECTDDKNNCGYLEGCTNSVGSFNCSGTCPLGYQLRVEYTEPLVGFLPFVPEYPFSAAVCSGILYPNSTFYPRGNYDVTEKRYCDYVGLCEQIPSLCFDPLLCVSFLDEFDGETARFTCAPCPSGYNTSYSINSGNGLTYQTCTLLTCNDVNPCDVAHGQLCLNTNVGPQCGPCPTGSQVDPQNPNQCLNINECASSVSHTCEGACLDLQFTGYTCGACPIGYEDAFPVKTWNVSNPSLDLQVCQDVNECSNSTITQQCDLGLCINTIGSYYCSACPSGYQTLVLSAQSQQCLDINECTNSSLSLCDPQYQNCTNTIGSYYCTHCPSGFSLLQVNQTERCLDINECTIMNGGCDSFGRVCINTIGSFYCAIQCPAGYQYDTVSDTCVDINECLSSQTHNCASTESCFNLIGSYWCGISCPPGYEGDSLNGCFDIDECTSGFHTCSVSPATQCFNYPGNYSCGPCPSGYYQFMTLTNVQQCLDVNECADPQNSFCDVRRNCTNVVGSYLCENCLDTSFNIDSQTCNELDECTFTTTISYQSILYSLTGLCHSPALTCQTIVSGQSFCSGVCPSGFVRQTVLTPAYGSTFNYNVSLCVDINECALNYCDPLQNCTNLAGSYSCGPCPSGYTFDTLTMSCQDVDECASSTTNICTSLYYQTCQNTIGGYLCDACITGYTNFVSGQACVDVNECVSNNGGCSTIPMQECFNTPGSHHCGPCPSGYITNGNLCQDIPECTLYAPCDSLTLCVEQSGSYFCTACPNGYSGTGATGCIDVDECSSTLLNNCDALASCSNTNGSYVCGNCTAAGYTTVRASDQDVFCQDIDECLYYPCDPLTGCTNQPGTFTCSSCPSGYTGTGLTGCVDINECTLGTLVCDFLTTCVNVMGGPAYCTACPSGYTGSGATGCIDVDECNDGNNGGCDPLQTCVNTLGSRTCSSCPSGYATSLNGTTCTDINECLYVCLSGGVCVNTPGSFTCTCSSGYTYNTIFSECTDIDECVTVAPCHPLQNCSNTIGSYTCSNCPAGYNRTSNTVCTDVDECLTATTLNPLCVSCTNLNGAYSCYCAMGYIWNDNTLQCDDVNECLTYSNLCNSAQNLTCVNTVGTFTCNGTCPSGYSFDSAHQVCVDNNECTDPSFILPDLCTSSNCINLPGTFACNCTDENMFTGYVWNNVSLTCDDVNECETSNGGCHGYRNCMNTNGSYGCGACTSGYFTNGSLTECFDINECDSILSFTDHCAVCNNTEGGFVCQCDTQYSWNSFNQRCEDINECAVSNGGCQSPHFTCINTEGAYICNGTCPSGYERVDNSTSHTTTCVDLNECTLYMPCSAQRNCTNTPGSFVCEECPAGFTASSSTTCQDIDECDPSLNLNKCQTPLRTCINTLGSYQCTPCPSPTYENNGTYNCTLTPIDPCTYCDPVYQMCIGSACTACPSGFVLMINSTTSVQRCVDVNECLASNGGCTTYQSCTNTVGSRVCNGAPCPTGYLYNSASNQCENVNECTLNTDTCVDSSELCVDTQGSFVCQPNCVNPIRPIYDPYTRTCRKINECLTNNGGCNSTSVCQWNNVTETVLCSYCGSGYYNLNDQCVDINECTFNNGGCHSLTVCENLNGTRACSGCPAGYFKVPNTEICQDINECTFNNGGCDTWRSCINTVGSFSCGPCATGSVLVGFTCVDVNECAVNNGGCDQSPYRSCMNSPTLSFTCGPCPTGFYDVDGYHCHDIDECTSSSTNNCILSTQNCINTNGSFTCVCKPGYVLVGGLCQPPQANLCDLTPEEGGCDPLQKCKKDKNKNYYCTDCPKGYLTVNGNTCVDINECSSNNGGCGTNKQCMNTLGSRTCVLLCPPGYTRRSNSQGNEESCEDVNECRINNGGCDNNSARCVNSPGSHRCVCLQGYQNHTSPAQQRSCQDVNECATNNGGCHSLTTCINTPGLFRCSRCPIGYQGNGVSGCIALNPCASSSYTCDPRCTCTPNPDSPYGRRCGPCPNGYFGNGDEACYPNSNTTTNPNNGGTISVYIKLTLTDESIEVPSQVVVALLPLRHADVRYDSIQYQPDIRILTIHGTSFVPTTTSSSCKSCEHDAYRAVATWIALPWDCYRVRVLSQSGLSWHEGEYDARSESRDEQKRLCVSSTQPSSLLQVTKNVYVTDRSSVVFYHHWDSNSTQDFDLSLVIKRQDNSTICRITRYQPYCLQALVTAPVYVGTGFNVIVLPNLMNVFKYIPVVEQLNPNYPTSLYQYLSIIPNQDASVLTYSGVSSSNQRYWYPACIRDNTVILTPNTFSSSLYPFLNTFC